MENAMSISFCSFLYFSRFTQFVPLLFVAFALKKRPKCPLETNFYSFYKHTPIVRVSVNDCTWINFFV